MASQLKLSEKMIEKLVIDKIESRLQHVKWGQNCIDVRDALSFESSLFTVEGPYTIDKSLIEEYLLHNGFAPKGKGSRKSGMNWEKWYFPINPKNDSFAEIRARVEESYQNYLNWVEEQSRSLVFDFAQSDFERASYIVNDVQYKAIERMMGEYNRETLIFNNKRNASYQRAFIKCEHCDNCPVVVLVKNENIEIAIAMATDSFFRGFLNYFYGFITYIIAQIRYSNIKDGKVCMYIDTTFFSQIKELFERVGMKFSLFPKYEVTKYFVVSEDLHDSSNHMPVYIELEHMMIQDIIPNGTEPIQRVINEEFKKLCHLINMKLNI